MKAVLFFSILFSSLATIAATTSANTKKPNTPATPATFNLKQQAHWESRAENNKRQALASDAQVSSGILSLEDPYKTPPPRSWKWLVGVKVQQYQPEGKVNLQHTQGINLNRLDSVNLPSLEFGFNKPWKLESKELKIKTGMLAHFGYASQDSQVMFVSGYKVNDARVNTFLSDLTLTANMGSNTVWTWLEGTAGVGVGTLSYTQGSDNAYARFNEQTRFMNWLVGANFNVNEPWQIFLNYNQRNLLANEEPSFSIQRDNWELGTRMQW